MQLRALLAALAAALWLAAPASAQEGEIGIPPDAPVCTGVGDTTLSCTSGDDPSQPVGPGQVITDPGEELGEPVPEDDPIPEDDEDVEGAEEELSERPAQRGEMHVLPGAASSSSATAGASDAEAAGASSPAQTADAAPAAQARTVAVADEAAGSRETLPFTGPDAGPLALMGLLLLAGGVGLRRAARAGA